MAKIKPTVGRVVWFYPHGVTQVMANEQPLAASIAHVHSDTIINIGYLDSNGVHANRTSVRLVQEGEETPNEPFCCWMPYQTGQAAKTEAAEAVTQAARKGFESLRGNG